MCRYDKTEGLKAESPELLACDYVLVGSDTLRSALLPYQRRYQHLYTAKAYGGRAKALSKLTLLLSEERRF